jgi:exo-beta-1,3-glucanase (GH17 family)
MLLLAAALLAACGNDGQGVNSPAPGLGSPAPGGSIGIDYTPESRCSDNNWTTTTPVACNPQLSFSCPAGNPLSLCPKSCQSCYVSDLTNLQSSLNTSSITSYQPNYYILTAAKQLHIKVIQGLFNDAIPSLAAANTATNCTYAGSPIKLCGSKYAGALLDGACGTTTPWDPAKFCTGGPYVEPLNNKTAPGQFITDGTIIAIQLGNEALRIKVNGQTVTAQMITAAAKTLRAALDARSFDTPIVVSLILGQEQTFCKGGGPPAGVDFIAAHPYCNFVASVPPSWPKNGAQCWAQVQDLFKTISQKSCGASHVFIGETGYNTGCPNSRSVPSTTISDEQSFISNLKSSTCPLQSPSGFPTFLFAYSDVCPATGCKPGCSDPGAPLEGNGYFGIFHTKDYLTQGPAVPKFTPPSLACP